jgi:formylglycine-generating enzyme required for sulfatase activity
MYKYSKTLFIIITLLFLILAACATKSNVPTFTSTPGIGSTWTRPADNMVMVYVPAGNFSMGSNSGYTDQQPLHTVYLDAFLIDKTEVTNAMYSKCVQTKACQPPSHNSSYTHISYFGNSQYADYPVVYVDWNDAQAYCKWAGVSLPTEAQWEKAARGTDGRTYTWGNSDPSSNLLNYNGNVGDTTAVGSYPSGASPYGALDMAGNVWEWLNDWYGETYYANSPSSNPTGPTSGQYRVVRGNAWAAVPSCGFVTTVQRCNDDQTDSQGFYGGDIGFRCATSVP